jgi:hypothetical protein
MTTLHRLIFSLLTPLPLAFLLASPLHAAPAAGEHHRHPETVQETGFLNRRITLHGVTYKFQVYVPEEWRRDDHKQWPILLFLHGRGERGTEGMWQTQVGLPQAVRDHPERWPALIVMPQCPIDHFWTDPAMLQMALASLDQESAEFHADPDRTYLTGLSMGGYGAWELARLQPKRWAAIVIASGGIFWSYSPDRWQQEKILPAEYARAVGKTSIWLFHGQEDSVVLPLQSELMFEAIRNNGGRVRLWIYQGLHHDSWTRAYDEPELPRWLFGHHLDPKPNKPEPPAFYEKLIIPQHPPALKLTPAQLDAITGDYTDASGHWGALIYRQGDQLFEKNPYGEVYELEAESLNTLFFPNGSSISRILIERNAQGRVTSLTYRDDRHEEHWERKASPTK